MSACSHPRSTSVVATQVANCIENVLAQPARVDALADRVQEMRECQAVQNETLGKLEVVVNKLLSAQAALLDQKVLLEEASKLQQVLGEQHFQNHVIDPLASRLIPLTDLACVSKAEQPDPSSLIHLVGGLREQLIELLGEFGCEEFESQEGDEFDPTCMRPIETRPAPSLELRETVASSQRPGFRTRDRILRPERVVTYTSTVLERSEEE